MGDPASRHDFEHARGGTQHAGQQFCLRPRALPRLHAGPWRRQAEGVAGIADVATDNRCQQSLDRGRQHVKRPRARWQTTVELNSHQVAAPGDAVGHRKGCQAAHGDELAAGLHHILIGDQDPIGPRCSRIGHRRADPPGERLKIGDRRPAAIELVRGVHEIGSIEPCKDRQRMLPEQKQPDVAESRRF
jgi:hypothetical protein